MAGRRDQWPQALLAPWAWHAEERPSARWRDLADRGILASRAVIMSVMLSIAFTAVGFVGWTSGAFSGSDANAGNTFEAASSFCSSPGTTTVVALTDTWVYQGAPTTNYVSDSSLYVHSETGRNARTLLKFTLPAVPSGCTVTSASLQLNAWFSEGPRTIETYRAGSSWSSTSVTWNTQPATTGTPATSASGTGWRSWDVRSHVQALYVGPNNGFILKDSSENGAALTQAYYALGNAGAEPKLSVTFG